MGKETVLKQHHVNHVPVLQHIVMRRLSDERVKRHRDIL